MCFFTLTSLEPGRRKEKHCDTCLFFSVHAIADQRVRGNTVDRQQHKPILFTVARVGFAQKRIGLKTARETKVLDQCSVGLHLQNPRLGGPGSGGSTAL